MDDLIVDPAPEVLAAEINAIKQQTGKILLAAALEIGRRLKAAKEQVNHGQWGKWLEESVSYSQATAERMIGLFKAYGDRQPSALDRGDAQGQSMANLSYTQALILLGVPEEERAQFLAEVDVEGMSTRELKKAVAERSQAVQERDQVLQEKADLRQALDDQAKQMTQLAAERDGLKAQAVELSKAQAASADKAGKLELELSSLKKSTNFASVQKMSKNLTAAHIRARSNRIAFLYESMVRNFKELVWEMNEFKENDPAAHETYKNQVIDFLAEGLKEKW